MNEEFIADLFAAYGNVPIKYLNKGVIHSQRGNIPTTQEIERVFLGELYHQWRKIMDVKPHLYGDLILHTEIGKVINIETVQRPDMVLHGGQIGPNRMTSNKIITELKMDAFDLNDFEKIYRAIQNLNYEFGVYIINNIGRQKIKNELRNISPEFPDYHNRIYFMNSKDGVFNLENLLIQ